MDESFITGIGGAWSVATNSTHVFWTNSPFDGTMALASIGRANLDGTEVNRNWIMSDRFSIVGVAVDSHLSPPPMEPLKSNPIRFGKLRHDRKKGTAVLDVWVPEHGELVVRSPKLGWKVLGGNPPPPWRSGSSRWRLKLWPGKGGRTAKRVKSQLRRNGRAPVSIWVASAKPERRRI